MLNKETVTCAESAKLKHTTDIFPCLSDCFSAEDDPAEDDKEESKEDLEGFFPCGQELSFGYLVRVFAVFAKKDEGKEKDGMVCTPSNEGPIGTMPEAGQEEDDKSVADDD